MRGLSLAATFVVVAIAAGCGGGFESAATRGSGSRALVADGIRVELPSGWTGRIVLGASGRPVLHAADFPVESNDSDEGLIAREAIGIDQLYLNVRDLGRGQASTRLPLRFEPSQFTQKSLCCRILETSQDVESDGELFRITVVSGSADPPTERSLAELNEAVASLQLEVYRRSDIDAAAGDAIDAYGLHANLPRGWEGRIGRGEIHAGDRSIDIQIDEYATADAGSFVTGRAPIEIGPAEFVHPHGGKGYETGRSFLLADRAFQLWVHAPEETPDAEALAKTNAFLASFSADAGDFYPGSVEPATFEAAAGWHTGSTGAADDQPQGGQTLTWASTIPYRDDGFQFPPHETLSALPADGMVIIAMLTRDANSARGPDRAPPFALGDFTSGGFEGVPSDRDTRVLQAHVRGGYDVALWAFFGRTRATQEQLADAQAEIDRLRLPRWSD